MDRRHFLHSILGGVVASKLVTELDPPEEPLPVIKVAPYKLVYGGVEFHDAEVHPFFDPEDCSLKLSVGGLVDALQTNRLPSPRGDNNYGPGSLDSVVYLGYLLSQPNRTLKWQEVTYNRRIIPGDCWSMTWQPWEQGMKTPHNMYIVVEGWRCTIPLGADYDRVQVRARHADPGGYPAHGEGAEQPLRVDDPRGR